MTEPILQTVNLKKNFGKLEVLKGISVDIHKGEVVSIIGPSGGGKSTFLRCLNLLEIPDEGKILYKGQDIQDKKMKITKYRQGIGMVFQHFNVFPNMTVLENVTLAPTLEKKVPVEQAKEEAMALLTRVGLADKAGEYPRKLSGGQKQRLALAVNLVSDKDIYIFDEATSALDNESERVVQESLEKLAKNRTTLVIAHRLSTIRNAERIVVLTEDGIAESGTHEQLLENRGIYYNLYNSVTL